MPGPSVPQVRDALAKAGWAQGKAHFLAVLLVRGKASTAEMAQGIETTEHHVRRIFHQLSAEGIVEAHNEHRKALGRRTKVYRLCQPEAFVARMVMDANSILKVLERLKPATPS